MIDPIEEFEEGTNINIKKKTTRKIEFLQSFLAIIIGLGILVFLCVIPIIFNFKDAKLSGKIFMILGTIYGLYLIVLILSLYPNPIKNYKFYFYFSPVLITFVIGIPSYISNELWGHKSIIIGLIFIWSMFLGFYVSVKALFKKSLLDGDITIILTSLALLIFVVAAINYKESDKDYALFFSKIGLGIVYLIATTLYVTKYIYQQNKSGKVINNIIGIVFWGSLIAISFPFYIKWCGLSGDNFNIFISIYTAVLSGGITLAGVAWTIKDSNDDKKKSLILQNKPIMYALLKNEKSSNNEALLDLVFIDLTKPQIIEKFEKYYGNINKPVEDEIVSDQQTQNEKIDLIILKSVANSDNSIIIVDKIIVDDIELTPLNNNIIAKGKIYKLIMTLSNLSENSKIRLYVKDVLNNQYCFNIGIIEYKDNLKSTKYGIMKIEEISNTINEK